MLLENVLSPSLHSIFSMIAWNMHVLRWYASSREPEKGQRCRRKGKPGGWKTEGCKREDKGGKISVDSALHRNPSVATLRLLCLAMLRVFKMSAVISSTIIRLCNRAPDAFRGEALRQHTLVPHLNTNTHTYTHSRFVQHWNNMRQRLMRWGYIRTATVLQFSTNAELMGGGRGVGGLGITVLGGRLWRVTRHSKPASPHALGRAPAMLLGSICCSSQLQVAEGASLQEDLTTRHLSLQNTGC